MKEICVPLFVLYYIYYIFCRFIARHTRWLWAFVWKQPTSSSLFLDALSDLSRSKTELVVENALLRQQLIVLRRQVNHPQLTNRDRVLLVLLASRLRTWKSILLIVQPDTLLRWHRKGFRLYWKRKSRTASHEPKLPTQTVELIKQMARENRLWGAERIRGELFKLDIRVCKRTVQKYMRQACRPASSERTSTQNWTTFLRNHAHQVWACDFLPVYDLFFRPPVYDLFFRPLFIFFIIELSSRRVVHFRVTRSPTDEWAAQQLREATAWGEAPRFLIRDNDSKYGVSFTRVAKATGIEVLRTPYRAPKANALCERFLGSVRRECLDHVLILSEAHLYRVIKEYGQYYNSARPHQGIGQGTPSGAGSLVSSEQATPGTNEAKRVTGTVVSLPVLGGLHHDYRKAA